MELPIELDEYPEPVHDCDRDLVTIDHPANTVDARGAGSSQGYQVYHCRVCNDYWGCRYQYDPGTGHDDHWKRFGPNVEDVKRHY